MRPDERSSVLFCVLRVLLLPLPPGGLDRLSSTLESNQNRQSQKPGGFCFGRKKMTPPLDASLPIPADKTSLTDDERIQDVVPLPPPEHLIRFFPIQGTPVEQMITETRR